MTRGWRVWRLLIFSASGVRATVNGLPTVRSGERVARSGSRSTVGRRRWSIRIRCVAARGSRDLDRQARCDRGRVFRCGCSRRLPWYDRPKAAALLAALLDPDRGFDAIVVGEYERAFAADQFEQLAPIINKHGVQVWIPEAGGPVEAGSPLHRILMTVLGAQSQREVSRARHGTLAAMRAQVRTQGRYLGGRPPYGYRLVDAGPHPNRTHAGSGRRLQRLDPDPVTAPHVKWIFAKRLTGRSAAGIARELNERGVPCPSTADPDRNRHRSGQTWSLRTIVEILRNPRYTGREVWDRVPGRNWAEEERGPVVVRRLDRFRMCSGYTVLADCWVGGRGIGE